jgi:TolB protein
MAVILAGVGGATAGARSAQQPQTLLTTRHRIYSFALASNRITWISRTHKRGRYAGCELYVRTLRAGLTSQAPVPRAGCGATPPVDFAPQAPVLASGVAAWVKGSSCGNIECFWQVATISGGEAKPRVVENADVQCDYTCDGSYAPRPALAGAGGLLIYSTGSGADPDTSVDRVRRIVGRHTASFATPPGHGDIERLVVGGGAVEAVSRVLVTGDGCGCVDSPVWSPDGSKVAYLHGQFWNQVIDPFPPHAALAVMNADGSGRRDLTAPADLLDPSFSWSPDGKQIAYVTPDGGNIAVANVDGSGSVQLGPGYDPAWSPDGSKIAFVSAGCGGSTAAISVMDANGANTHQVATLGPGPTCVDVNGIAWSPDGTRIAFDVNGILEAMNADGSNVHQLGSAVAGSEPDWSPDSSQVVFHEDSGLWKIGADGSGLHQITNGADEHPSWSPDGTTIVFGSRRDDPYSEAGELSERASPELYLVDPDGSDLRPLSFTTPTMFEHQTTFYTASGTPLPSFPGVPTLAGNVAAVGSTVSGVARITLYDRTTGAQVAVVQVGPNHGGFAVAGAYAHWVVFGSGRTISALDVDSRAVVHLATAANVTPLDLSVSGRRVAWVENFGGHGRIRALTLSP